MAWSGGGSSPNLPFPGRPMSSGQMIRWRDDYYAHTCGWQGMAEFAFDPEHSTSTETVQCVGCHEVVEIPVTEW
jgi:hypothetical protein